MKNVHPFPKVHDACTLVHSSSFIHKCYHYFLGKFEYGLLGPQLFQWTYIDCKGISKFFFNLFYFSLIVIAVDSGAQKSLGQK